VLTFCVNARSLFEGCGVGLLEVLGFFVDSVTGIDGPAFLSRSEVRLRDESPELRAWEDSLSLIPVSDLRFDCPAELGARFAVELLVP